MDEIIRLMSGKRMVAYDDCGVPMRDPHVRRGVKTELDRSRISEAKVKIQREFMVASDPNRVELHYEGLDPDAKHWVAVKWATESDRPRTQRIEASGHFLAQHDLSRGRWETHLMEIPSEAVKEGRLDLSVTETTGESVVVSEVALWSDRGVAELTFYVSADALGSVIGTVGDVMFAPVKDCPVTITHVPSGKRLNLTTDELGCFRFPIDSLTPERTGSLHLVASMKGDHGFDCYGETRFDVCDLPLALTLKPESVQGVQQATLSLDGPWRVGTYVDGCVDPEFDDSSWLINEVPGHWVTQGFAPPDGVAVHRRLIDIPADFAGKRVLLRFDAVYSEATVYVNGIKCGKHVGGATAFIVDATEAAKPGESNVIALIVKEYTDASILDYMSWYGHMPMAGIWRPAELFAAPHVHLSRCHVETRFDDDYVDATLAIEAMVTNESANQAGDIRIEWSLFTREGEPVPFPVSQETMQLGPYERRAIQVEGGVTAPVQWDSENPYLYTLIATLYRGDQVEATYKRRIGFREIEIKNRQLLVNGRKVTLRGVNRHDGHIKRGRALTKAEWEKEIELLLGANVNAVRTSHYPAAEQFIEMCDEAGIYVQEAAPICFAGGWSASRPMEDAYGLPRMAQVVLELIERDRSHPSIIVWDLANESAWGPNFERVHQWLKERDPTRPTLFSHDRDITSCEVRSLHYPGGTVFGLEPGVDRIKQTPRPVIVDEYGAVFQSCQSWVLQTGELALDPGLRDFWVTGTRNLWEEMRVVPNCAGGMIWTWGDDYFHATASGKIGEGAWSFLPANRFRENIELVKIQEGQLKGEGEWGMVDGWQRPRPEWWHTKKMYSPVVIRRLGGDYRSMTLQLEIENRYDRTNLSEIDATWSVGDVSGTLALEAPAGETIRVELPLPDLPGIDQKTVEIQLKHKRTGRLVDMYRFPVDETAGTKLNVEPDRLARGPLTITGSDTDPVVRRGDWTYRFDREHGGLQVSYFDRPVITGGPFLHVLPLIGGRSLVPIWDNHWPEQVSFDVEQDTLLIHIASYYDFFRGSYDLRLKPDGVIEIDYRFNVFGQQVFHAREVGIRMTLPDAFDTLEWHRRGEWNAYPDDHIGRTRGRAQLNEGVTSPLHPRESWYMETTPRGSNDFRSSKRNIYWARLTTQSGLGVGIQSDGTQHVRVMKTRDGMALHVNDYFGGASSYFNAEAWIPAFGLGQKIDHASVLVGQLRLVPFAPNKG